MTAEQLLQELPAEHGFEVLGMLGFGLSFASEPLSSLVQALDYQSQNTDGDGDRLAKLSMRRALRRIRTVGDETLLARLEDATELPWPAVYQAVLAVDVEPRRGDSAT